VRFYNSHSVSDLIFDGLELTDFSDNAFRIHYGSNIVIRNCYIHDFKTYQSGAVYIGGYNDSVTADIVIENNRFERIGANGTRGTYVNGDHMIYLSKAASNVTVRNNYFKGNYSGYAIHQYHSPSSINVDIHNNVFILTTGHIRAALRLEGGTDFQFNNNTIVAESSGSDATYPIRMGGGTMIAKNNVFHGSTTGGYIYKTGGTLNADYNLYWPGGIDSDDKATRSKKADPLFVNVASDWRLKTASAAINSGDYTGLAYDADWNSRVGAPDIGAYEYTTGDSSAPSVPTGLKATAISSSQIDLTWAASTDNIGVAGYKVYRNGSQIATTQRNSYSNTGLTASTAYSYTVAAYDAAGNTSAQSTAVPAKTLAAGGDVQAPTVPSNVKAAAISSSRIDISWTASTDNTGVAGYKVYRNGTLTAITTTTNHSDTGLSPSTAYSYSVASYDAAGNNSAQSAKVSATTSACLNPAVMIDGTAPAYHSSLQSAFDEAVAGNTLKVQGVVFKENLEFTTNISVTWTEAMTVSSPAVCPVRRSMVLLPSGTALSRLRTSRYNSEQADSPTCQPLSAEVFCLSGISSPSILPA
jgi:chitodextrinase